MKPTMFKNKLNNDKFICDDLRLTENIDGVEYILVRKPDTERKFLMRKDALEKIPNKLIKDKNLVRN